jgi:hypothetical protein
MSRTPVERRLGPASSDAGCGEEGGADPSSRPAADGEQGELWRADGGDREPRGGAGERPPSTASVARQCRSLRPLGATPELRAPASAGQEAPSWVCLSLPLLHSTELAMVDLRAADAAELLACRPSARSPPHRPRCPSARSPPHRPRRPSARSPPHRRPLVRRCRGTYLGRRRLEDGGWIGTTGARERIREG